MSKAIIQITIREDRNDDYVRRELITVDYDTYDKIADCMETYTVKQYDEAWTQLLNEIVNQVSDLPENWYIDRSERKLIECY